VSNAVSEMEENGFRKWILKMCTFMDLENVYARVARMAMWTVLNMYGVGGKSLSAIKSLYEEIMVFVRIGRKLG
jgi:hypothetical protein